MFCRDVSAKRDALFEKLKEIRAKIPTKTLNYNKAFHGDLIGAKGATIQGLQEEFGVVLNVSYDKGEIQIKYVQRLPSRDGGQRTPVPPPLGQ